LWELAPDQRVDFNGFCPAVGRHAVLGSLRREGTLAEGGAFESDYLWLCCATDGRITQLELFELEDLDKALDRFERLRPDPLCIPPNAATLVIDHINELRESGNIASLRATAAEDFRFNDRSRRSLVSGGIEEWLRAIEFLWNEIRGRLVTRRIATAGDRLVLDKVCWYEAPGEGRFEIDSIRLVEADAAGKLRALVFFSPDDRAAASAELFERYVACGADGMPAGAIELSRAVNDHDLERMRAALPVDLVVHDHRRTGIGLLETAEAWIESVAAIYELSPDVRVDDLRQVAVAPHGRVCVGRMWGSNIEGGEFESYLVRLFLYQSGRIVRIEVFEIEDLDTALARFEELSAELSDPAERA
jgi:hypothetical protein